MCKVSTVETRKRMVCTVCSVWRLWP